ncbi:TPA: hypothetical protein L6A29_08540, partial [Pseudomonas aeruginosa]|nr:hypothetical protein [Pseudomonas aeruginosa]HBP6114484.1 hypothetical protein [Pseudomonas aeruginosa]HBP6472927.1 hypothetical protein [Pseudomonas aeruginosa]HBP6591783.1 hypothetical protein [Pseudomonas aeruginosa]
MEAKTYASAKGAKAVAKKAGFDPELVQINEVQTDEGTRYTYTEDTSEGEALEAMEQERDEAQNPDAPEYQADAPADAVVTTGKPKKEPKPKIVRVEQNGVKRPAPGGLCAAVWEWLDENGNCMPKDLKPVAEAKGWNLNNAQIELYQWRKFSGIAGR